MTDLLNGKAWLGEYEGAVRARLTRFTEERVVAFVRANTAVVEGTPPRV